jgi:hypothetical protein
MTTVKASPCKSKVSAPAQILSRANVCLDVARRPRPRPFFLNGRSRQTNVKKSCRRQRHILSNFFTPVLAAHIHGSAYCCFKIALTTILRMHVNRSAAGYSSAKKHTLHQTPCEQTKANTVIQGMPFAFKLVLNKTESRRCHLKSNIILQHQGAAVTLYSQ